MTPAPGPELIIGLVTPIGTNTTELANALAGSLADYGYTPIQIKMSAQLPSEPQPLGEAEDHRVQRLIAAGDAFCKIHTRDNPNGDPAALARLAIREIRRARLALHRQDGDQRPVQELIEGRSRTAYILHSLKRPAEVQLLREIYGEQFVLIGSQGSVQQRQANLMQRPMSASAPEDKHAIIAELMRLDADESDRAGQRVNETYPLADFFLRNNDAADRTVRLLFGEPIAPEVGEYAMYVARASRARSLAASRKVGATIVVDDAVIATGYNDAPHGHTPDVLEGDDTSERLKRENVLDTVRRLRQADLLSDTAAQRSDSDLTSSAMVVLKGGELLSVIEYQRAVHAEAKAIDDATVRGVSPKGGTLYVTTFPCHLCYKHALSVQLTRVEYIEPYPKSRAVSMYPQGSDERLVPYAGVAPRRYIEIFDERPPFLSDPSGKFQPIDRALARPLLGRIRNDADRDAEERLAVNGLQEEYR